ncbi:MAG: ribonuclease P protein component [Gammaproteobacteria bacterium]|nr:ribonuclease P protein component [Gammaproteobacteria bacterium]
MNNLSSGYTQAQRLRVAAEFDVLFRLGTRASDAYFTVIAHPNALGHARLGIAVSKKVSCRAVDRNRLKRLLRESFRQSAVRTTALDIVVLAKPTSATANRLLLGGALDKRWQSLIFFSKQFLTTTESTLG